MQGRFVWLSRDDTLSRQDFVDLAVLLAPNLRGVEEIFDDLFEAMRKRGGPTFCSSLDDCQGRKCRGEHRISRHRLVRMSNEEERLFLSKMRPSASRLILNIRAQMQKNWSAHEKGEILPP